MTRCLLSLIATSAFAAGPLELPVWPGDAPGSEGKPNVEVIEKGADGERRTRLVTKPTITVHLPPADSANGTAVIVCPGGGYRHHAIDKEGHDVARWLNTIGVAGIVLKYRVMTAEMAAQPADPSRTLRGTVSEWALADAKQAMKLVRSHAAEWRIRPDRVGIMGFSAGGHLTASFGVRFDAETRPAFLGIMYGAAPDSFEPAQGGPPAFIVHASDDRTVPATASTRMYDALKKAGAPVELHIFAKGGHGFGIRKHDLPTDDWTGRMRDWMQISGFLGGK